jgi:hypothetical protein
MRGVSCARLWWQELTEVARDRWGDDTVELRGGEEFPVDNVGWSTKVTGQG